MNKALLVGRISSDIDVQDIEGGKRVANFSVTTRHREKTDTHRIVAWDEAARIVSFLRRGDPVFIEGRIQTGGRHAVEIVAWTIYPLKGRAETEQMHTGTEG